MTRPSWGHVSRCCLRCGKVGPRVMMGGGWVHFYCLTDAEKRERRKAQSGERPCGNT
jgi:hypothetical protein